MSDNLKKSFKGKYDGIHKNVALFNILEIFQIIGKHT
jgi:hypothetical protein